MPPRPRREPQREQTAELANIVRWLRERADALRALAAELEAGAEVEAAQRWLGGGGEVAAAVRMIEEEVAHLLRMSFEMGPLSARDYPAYRQGPASQRRLKRRPRCPGCHAIAADTRCAGSTEEGDRLISRCRKGHVWEYVGLGQ
jgi:hypothetical protein